MPIVFMDDSLDGAPRDIATEIRFKAGVGNSKLQKRGRGGFVIAIIILSLLLIGSSVSVFFYAKGLGWNEAVSQVGQEYYNNGYAQGRVGGYDSGYRRGYGSGYDSGFEDARRCASMIVSGFLRSSIYACYYNQYQMYK